MGSAVREELAALVAALARPPVEAGEVTEGTRLFEGGLGLSSVDALELVVALEERYGVEIAADEVGGEDFAVFGRLVALTEARRQT
jgi:acyl carrier protein